VIFAEAKISYDDIRIEGKDWPAIKDKQPFQQLPVLEVGNQKIAQSGAIERYVAKITHLYGANDLEAAQVDQVVEGLGDTLVKFRAANQEKDANVKKEKHEAYFKDEFPKWGGYLEALLKANTDGKGYFVGNGVTYADIAFYVTFSNVLEANPSALEHFPLLAALHKRVGARPNIKHWVDTRPKTPF